MMSSRRDMAASQVTHRGEGFSSGPPGGFQVPLAIYQRDLAALDLEAEPAAALGPDGKVQLGRPGVPLPLVDWRGPDRSLDLMASKTRASARRMGSARPIRGELLGLGNPFEFLLG